MKRELTSTSCSNITAEVGELGVYLTSGNGDKIIMCFEMFKQLNYMVKDAEESIEKKEQLKQQALSKLTQEEREALGF